MTAETKSNTYATVCLKQQYSFRSVSLHVDVNSSAAELNRFNDGNDTGGENLNLLLTNHTLFSSAVYIEEIRYYKAFSGYQESWMVLQTIFTSVHIPKPGLKRWKAKGFRDYLIASFQLPDFKKGFVHMNTLAINQEL